MGLNINWRFQKPEQIKVRQYNYNQNLSQLGQGLEQVAAAVQTSQNKDLDEELAKLMQEANGLGDTSKLDQWKANSITGLDNEAKQLQAQLQALTQELQALENTPYNSGNESPEVL